MIHANRIVTVGEQECIIDRPIVLYRGDREVEIEFTLVGNEFMFSEEGNVIKSVNASHGQLVLNTPSGEHMFSELAECHEGKVVFVVTKEMIDEFIEMGFYSFQIRLYDSAEMKSRVTIPPVMNGFDIRNPIAAEDETNVVDQGIVDYARIFKDQSNEELPTFDWTGAYNKTEWVHHNVITENKMNKIEDALYSINANIKESDVVMLNALDNVKKDADAYVKEHMAEVEADVDEFERNLNTDVQQFKIDVNAAMTAHKNEVSEVINTCRVYVKNYQSIQHAIDYAVSLKKDKITLPYNATSLSNVIIDLCGEVYEINNFLNLNPNNDSISHLTKTNGTILISSDFSDDCILSLGGSGHSYKNIISKVIFVGQLNKNVTGIKIISAINTTIENCQFIDVNRGIYDSQNSHETIIKANHFLKNDGVEMLESAIETDNDSIISDNVIIGYNVALKLNGNGNIVKGNHFYNVDEWGIDCDNNSMLNSITNNYFDGCCLRIGKGGYQSVISNNLFTHQNKYSAIYTKQGGEGQWLQRVNITNNSIVPSNSITPSYTISGAMIDTPMKILTINTDISLNDKHVGAVVVNSSYVLQLTKILSKNQANFIILSGVISDYSNISGTLQPTNVCLFDNDWVVSKHDSIIIENNNTETYEIKCGTNRYYGNELITIGVNFEQLTIQKPANFSGDVIVPCLKRPKYIQVLSTVNATKGSSIGYSMLNQNGLISNYCHYVQNIDGMRYRSDSQCGHVLGDSTGDAQVIVKEFGENYIVFNIKSTIPDSDYTIFLDIISM